MLYLKALVPKVLDTGRSARPGSSRLAILSYVVAPPRPYMMYLTCCWLSLAALADGSTALDDVQFDESAADNLAAYVDTAMMTTATTTTTSSTLDHHGRPTTGSRAADVAACKAVGMVFKHCDPVVAAAIAAVQFPPASKCAERATYIPTRMCGISRSTIPTWWSNNGFGSDMAVFLPAAILAAVTNGAPAVFLRETKPSWWVFNDATAATIGPRQSFCPANEGGWYECFFLPSSTCHVDESVCSKVTTPTTECQPASFLPESAAGSALEHDLSTTPGCSATEWAGALGAQASMRRPPPRTVSRIVGAEKQKLLSKLPQPGHGFGTFFITNRDERITWLLHTVALFFQPNARMKAHLVKTKKRIGMTGRRIGLHIRHSDYIIESEEIAAEAFCVVAAQMARHTGIRAFFLASDDPRITPQVFAKCVKDQAKANKWMELANAELHVARQRDKHVAGSTEDQEYAVGPNKFGMSAVTDLMLLSDCEGFVSSAGSSFSHLARSLAVVKGITTHFWDLDCVRDRGEIDIDAFVKAIPGLTNDFTLEYDNPPRSTCTFSPLPTDYVCHDLKHAARGDASAEACEDLACASGGVGTAWEYVEPATFFRSVSATPRSATAQCFIGHTGCLPHEQLTIKDSAEDEVFKTDLRITVAAKGAVHTKNLLVKGARISIIGTVPPLKGTIKFVEADGKFTILYVAADDRGSVLANHAQDTGIDHKSMHVTSYTAPRKDHRNKRTRGGVLKIPFVVGDAPTWKPKPCAHNIKTVLFRHPSCDVDNVNFKHHIGTHLDLRLPSATTECVGNVLAYTSIRNQCKQMCDPSEGRRCAFLMPRHRVRIPGKRTIGAENWDSSGCKKNDAGCQCATVEKVTVEECMQFGNPKCSLEAWEASEAGTFPCSVVGFGAVEHCDVYTYRWTSPP